MIFESLWRMLIAIYSVHIAEAILSSVDYVINKIHVLLPFLSSREQNVESYSCSCKICSGYLRSDYWLDSGAFGDVYVDKNRKQALKFVRAGSFSDLQNVINECKALCELSCTKHPHILNMSDFFLHVESKTNEKFVVIVSDLIQSGNMVKFIQRNGLRLSSKQLLRVCRQSLCALQEVHSNGFVHRDIKPENILFHISGNVIDIKLADFGLSVKTSRHIWLSGLAGTEFYMSPEMLSDNMYNAKTDIYSLAATILELGIGEELLRMSHTFFAKQDLFIIRFDRRHPQVSKKFRHVLGLMIQTSVHKRPFTREVLALYPTRN